MHLIVSTVTPPWMSSSTSPLLTVNLVLSVNAWIVPISLHVLNATKWMDISSTTLTPFVIPVLFPTVWLVILSTSARTVTKLPNTSSTPPISLNAILVHWKDASTVLPWNLVTNATLQQIMGLVCWTWTSAVAAMRVASAEDTTCLGMLSTKVVLQCVETESLFCWRNVTIPTTYQETDVLPNAKSRTSMSALVSLPTVVCSDWSHSAASRKMGATVSVCC